MQCHAGSGSFIHEAVEHGLIKKKKIYIFPEKFQREMVFVSETTEKEPIWRQSIYVLHIFLHTLKYYFVTLQQGLSDLGTWDWKKLFNALRKFDYILFSFVLNITFAVPHYSQVNLHSDMFIFGR